MQASTPRRTSGTWRKYLPSSHECSAAIWHTRAVRRGSGTSCSMSAYSRAKRSAICGVMKARGMLRRWMGSRAKAASAMVCVYLAAGISNGNRW